MTADELAARRVEQRGIRAQQVQARADVATWGLLIGRDLHGPHHDLRLDLLAEAVAMHDTLRAEHEAHLTLIERAS